MPEPTDQVVSERPSGDGWRVRPGLSLPPQRRRMVSWVAVGILGAVLSALGLASWAAAQDDRVGVLALRRGIAAGEHLTQEHLREALVAADTGGLVGSGDAERLIGQRALADLPEGTLVASALFAPSVRLGPGEAVVGVALDPAELPLATLGPGDGLLLVRTPPPEAAGFGDDAQGEVLTWWGEVFDVTASPDAASAERRVTVSLRVAEAYAPAISAAAATGRLHLVLVASAGPLTESPAASADLDQLLGDLGSGTPDAPPPPEEEETP